MLRPQHFGADVEIDSLETADLALHELGWLQHELARLGAVAKQKIEKIKDDLTAAAVVAIDGVDVPITERIKDLAEALEDWTLENIRGHLNGKKTKVLSHGELGLRQQPMVVEIDVDPADSLRYTESAVLGWIEESELTPSQRKALTETKVSLHLKGAKDALEARKITREQLKQVGLAVRDEFDGPVVKPAKIPVTAEQ